eukprot:618909_1
MAKPNEKARAAADEELLRRRKENKHREHSSARKRAYHQAQSSDSHGGATIPGPSTGYYESHPGEKALSDVRVRQRNLVYITGLPLSHAKEEILRGNDYFGQFGHIRKLSVIRRPPGGSVGRQAATAYVTYKRDQDAMEAIAALSDTTIDGHVIRSSFGTTKYCTAYAKQLTCTNPNCMYIHALAPASECYTKDDLGTERFQEESLMEAREQCEKQQRISASRTPIIRSPMMSPQQSPVLGPQQFPPLGSDHRAIHIPLGRPPTAPSSVGHSRAFSKHAQAAPASEPKRQSQESSGGLGARVTKPAQIKTDNSNQKPEVVPRRITRSQTRHQRPVSEEKVDHLTPQVPTESGSPFAPRRVSFDECVVKASKAESTESPGPRNNPLEKFSPRRLKLVHKSITRSLDNMISEIPGSGAMLSYTFRKGLYGDYAMCHPGQIDCTYLLRTSFRLCNGRLLLKRVAQKCSKPSQLSKKRVCPNERVASEG